MRRAQVSQLCEGVQQLKARALLMLDETPDVSPVNTAPRKLQVCARTSGDATQLHFALRRSSLGVRLCGSQCQPDVSLQTGASVEHHLPEILVPRRVLLGRILDARERRQKPALRALDSFLALTIYRRAFSLRIAGRLQRTRALKTKRDERERPDDRRDESSEQRARAVRRRLAEEIDNADGSGGGQVDGDDFAQTHDATLQGNACADRAARLQTSRERGFQHLSDIQSKQFIYGVQGNVPA